MWCAWCVPEGEITVEVSMRPYGGSQSDYLIHFTKRGNRPNAEWVPAEIRAMSAEERLRAIVTEGVMKPFRPYGAHIPCVCFTETTIEHLRFLLKERGYTPWGIVMTRGQVLAKGGGTVAYINNQVTLAQFDRAGLRHWAVRTGGDTDWTYEREWRIPWPSPDRMSLRTGIRAIFIPDESWRPVPEGEELPELWLKTPIWVWNAKENKVAEHPPGDLA